VFLPTTFLLSKHYAQVFLRSLKLLVVRRSGLVRPTLDPHKKLSLNIFLEPVSSGFATVHPNNKLTVNVVEAAPLEEFSLEVRSSISHVTRYLYRPYRLFGRIYRKPSRLLQEPGQRQTKLRHGSRQTFTRHFNMLWLSRVLLETHYLSNRLLYFLHGA
jgi:hypothetical protein